MNPTMTEVDSVLEEMRRADMKRYDQRVDRRRRRLLWLCLGLTLASGCVLGLILGDLAR